MLPIALYRTLLSCYPGSFREEYGAEMVCAFAEQLRSARQHGGWRAELSVWAHTSFDLFLTAPQEHLHVIRQDLRYAIRTLASQPGFAAAAVLSLALGIGANSAIFSVLNDVMLSALPVRDPESIVLLTNPVSSGVAQGSQSNERSLLTYSEFEQLRDGTDVFSSLMASQSQMERAPARVDGAEAEEIRYRMVSTEYFGTLGVPALLGRTFADDDDRGAAHAVISYAYWQRRFGGSADVLGRKIEIRAGVLSIVGVTPRTFFGETVGERPDVWLPLSMQPAVLPGRDWLREKPGDVEKVMWLHAFGRLKPGVTLEKAQAAANLVFHQGLEAYYATVESPEDRKRFLNQRLRLRPAATGASQVRRFAEPLIVLLGAAMLVLLIACANLSNLLLARATTRTREMSVRLALGAGRGRLIRQILTESMVIAFLGGIAGLAATWVLRIVLLRMASDSMYLPLALDVRMLAFTFGLTLAAGLILGLIPALCTIRVNAAAGLKEQGRGLTGSAAWMRAGRFVVVGQLALSLPLLIGAGLLLLTLHNLQQVNLGFEKERLLIVEVDAETAGYEPSRRPALFQHLLERVRATPGVRAATYANNGLFSGSDSGDEVLVEGYTRTGDNDRSSRYNHVGPDYFSALGVPVLLGREITERDQLSRRVCVINEAFARRFFDGRSPIGMHVTQIFAQQRNTYEIIGVARDSRATSLRGTVEPRFYVPAAQPISPLDSASFTIRTIAEPTSVLSGVRRAILGRDPNLPITVARPLGEIINGRMAQDKLMARLSIAFGVVALLLSAIGLYGVLSYGVARRRNEIGIRKALGAPHGAVITMILRETGWMLVVGLVTGAALSAAGLRLINSQLYGVAPTDPVAFAAAIAVLTGVALMAAWVPAHRASRVDPLLALRYE
ncbi:MAG TPA: ABC transporter permease [Bryobacteraceae bacterium]|nr:ABC transporter permease [Bryobacteraceae bacterium]